MHSKGRDSQGWVKEKSAAWVDSGKNGVHLTRPKLLPFSLFFFFTLRRCYHAMHHFAPFWTNAWKWLKITTATKYELWHQCYLLHNLHLLLKVIHLWNRKTTRWPFPWTPSWRRQKWQGRIQISRWRLNLIAAFPYIQAVRKAAIM